jgi:hypothetical protein
MCPPSKRISKRGDAILAFLKQISENRLAMASGELIVFPASWAFDKSIATPRITTFPGRAPLALSLPAG